MKKAAAHAALTYVKEGKVIGVGTGSTINFFIGSLSAYKHKIEGAVASSLATAEQLKAQGIPVLELNNVSDLCVYVDGTDEINPHFQLIKGAGGALTREKIIASAAKQFVCVADESKYVPLLGEAPLPVEVIPMARSYVARELVKLGGFPTYRQGVITDNGNVILDVHNLPIMDAVKLEQTLNNIAGVVCHGLFAKRTADILLLGTTKGVNTLRPE